MHAKKEIVPEKDLIWTMLFCFILGIMPILFSLWIFLFYWDVMQLKGDGLGSDSVFENLLALIRILTFGLMPMMGFGFFCAGYMVWKCRRQCKALRKENDGNRASAI
jgi:sorbitol-specific phosphotransferase system component IIC